MCCLCTANWSGNCPFNLMRRALLYILMASFFRVAVRFHFLHFGNFLGRLWKAVGLQSYLATKSLQQFCCLINKLICPDSTHLIVWNPFGKVWHPSRLPFEWLCNQFFELLAWGMPLCSASWSRDFFYSEIDVLIITSGVIINLSHQVTIKTRKNPQRWQNCRVEDRVTQRSKCSDLSNSGCYFWDRHFTP